jgi:hypothetical protein
MIILEILSIVLAAVLLFMPVTGLFWYFLSSSPGYADSGFILAYAVIAVFVCEVAALVRYLAFKQSSHSLVGIFLGAALALTIFTCAIGIWLAFALNVIDSSHGGSLILQVLGCLGITFAATAWLVHKTRMDKTTLTRISP